MENKITRTKTIETAVLLVAVILYFAWRYQNWDLVIAAFALLVLALVIPIIFYPIAKLWFGLGLLLGLISTNILLTLVFFIMITPVALFKKWFGKDTLSMKAFKKGTCSTLITRNHQYTPEDLKNQF